MRVQIELFATLQAYLAASELELPTGSTVDDVAAHLGIPPDFARITLVNGQDARGEQRLHDGDVVSMFPPLAGGRSPKISGLPAERSR